MEQRRLLQLRDLRTPRFAPVEEPRFGSSAKAAARETRLLGLPWLVLAVGIPASILLFTAVAATLEDIARLRFERQASDARRVIDVRVHTYAGVLYGLRALFASRGEVSRLDFRNFVRALDLPNRYPSLESVNYMVHVPGADKARFEQWVRSDTSVDPRGYPQFAIHPPGERPEYFVLVYLEPLEGFEFAFGRDLGANPAAIEPGKVAAAVRLTRDSGQLTASGQPLYMKSATRQYVGLAMRLAVYRPGMPTQTVDDRRSAFVGSVGAGFNVDDLMKGVLDEHTSQYMTFQLYDAGSARQGGAEGDTTDPRTLRLLYSSGRTTEATARPAVDGSAFTRVLPLEVGGRVWEVHFSAPKDRVIDRYEALSPWATLFAGVLSSVLLYGVLYSLASSRARAEKLASEMTRSLRESQSDLAQAHALLSDAQKLAGVGCCQYNLADGQLIWSEELYRIHGVDPRDFSPSYASALELAHPADRGTWSATLEKARLDGAPFTVEFRIVRPDGAVRHVRSLGEVVNDDAGKPQRMLWSVLDITEHKQTEHVLRRSAEQLTALSRRLVEVQETERRTLSRELHDRVGQNLTALSINLDILSRSLGGEVHAEHRARIRDSVSLLESTVDSIENVMAELRPPMLDDYGLLPALHWYAKDFSRRTGIEVAVHGDDHAERLASGVEIALFRIAQEALTNVSKHAGASQACIWLRHENGSCVMTVTDNGIGIDPRTRSGAHRHGLGMVNMRERSQAVGGRFSVRNSLGGGTEIEIAIP